MVPRRIEVRFGPVLATEGVRGAEARAQLDDAASGCGAALLPDDEPKLPSRRPGAFLTDLFNGADDIARRRGGR